MTYWINVFQPSQRIGAAPEVQHWATEEQAVEEIVAGSPGYYYDETIRVEGQAAKVINLEPPARERDPKARRVNMAVETEAAE